MSRLKDRMPSPALVIALVALFVALSGSAVAATTFLVHTDNIANGAVTRAKLARTVQAALTKAGEPRGTVSGPKARRERRGQPARRERRGPRARTVRMDRTDRTAGTA